MITCYLDKKIDKIMKNQTWDMSGNWYVKISENTNNG